MLAIDLWDGTASQVQSYKNATSPQVQFPLLMNGSPVQNDYQVSWDWSMIIDHEGIIQYSGSGAPVNTLKNKIDELLTTSLKNTDISSHDFNLYGNYPNPFGAGLKPHGNPKTTIKFSLDRPQKLTLQIFDMQGRLIKTLAQAFFTGGFHEISWSGKDSAGKRVASGSYLYRLSGTGRVESGKMLVIQ